MNTDRSSSLTSSDPSRSLSIKIVILGNSSVGKTCLLSRFCDNIFLEGGMPTIAIDLRKKLIVQNEFSANVEFWDTAGQERYHSLAKNFLRGADGVIFAFDLTDEQSFESLPIWVEVASECTEGKIPSLVLGNKCDQGNKEVTLVRANDFAEKIGSVFWEVSARDRTNVEEAIVSLIRRIAEVEIAKGAGSKKNKLKGKDERETGKCC